MSEAEDQVIYETVLDLDWSVRVIRISESFGELTVTSSKRRERLVVDVPLAYGAKFGPDVDDVQAWQDAAIAFVDGLAANES